MRSEEWGNAQKHFLWGFERQEKRQVDLPFLWGFERREKSKVNLPSPLGKVPNAVRRMRSLRTSELLHTFGLISLHQRMLTAS